MIKTEMTHLVRTLNSYIMFEVLETSWRELDAWIKQAENLDDLVEAHRRFLDGVLRKVRRCHPR